MTLASTSSSGSLSSATPIPNLSPRDLEGIDLIGILGAKGKSFSPSITVRLYYQSLRFHNSDINSLDLFQVLGRIMIVGVISQDLKLISRAIVLHTNESATVVTSAGGNSLLVVRQIMR